MAYALHEVVKVANRRRDQAQFGCACEGGAREKFYPVCRIGQALIFAGLALAFLSFVFGFWLALLGALLIVVGFLVIMSC